MNPNENYMNQMPLPGTEPKSGGTGPVIAVIIIIALLALGGYYFWTQVKDKNMQNQDQSINPELQSTSTEGISAELQADLEALQKDDLGEGDVQSIDGEFNQ